jgi:prepilin-type N-terminal cleavage/methylation domain-containing protein
MLRGCPQMLAQLQFMKPARSAEGVRPNEHSVCSTPRYPVFAMSRLTINKANRAMTLIEVLVVILMMTIAAVMTVRLSIP